MKSLEVQHFAKDATDAGARAIVAGLDMEMCMTEPAFGHLAEAVAQGLVPQDLVDDAVRRVLTAKFRLGLFENPYADEAAADAVVTAPEHRDLARTTAEQTFVLLKNDGAALPLAAEGLQSVAVIGQLADSKRDTLGRGCRPTTSPRP